MDGLRRRFINAANEVAVDGFGDEGYHRRCGLSRGHECRPEGHVGVNLILLHALGPETGTAAAHIPVGQFIRKGLQSLGGFCYLIAPQVAVHFLNHGI